MRPVVTRYVQGHAGFENVVSLQKKVERTAMESGVRLGTCKVVHVVQHDAVDGLPNNDKDQI